MTFSRFRGELMLAGSLALVGANVALGKVIAAHWPVEAFLVFRFALAVAALAALGGFAHAFPGVLSAQDRRDLLVQALFGMVGFTMLLLWGTALAGAVAAGIVAGALPAATALLGAAVLRERLRARDALSVALAGLGVVLLALGLASDGALRADALGLTLLLGAIACEALFIVHARRVSAKMTPEGLSARVNLTGLVLSLPLLAGAAALGRLDGFDPAALSWQVWALSALYVLNASVFALMLWYRGLPHVPAARAGVLTVVVPVTAAGLGVAALGEPATLWHAAGLAAVAGAIVAGARR